MNRAAVSWHLSHRFVPVLPGLPHGSYVPSTGQALSASSRHPRRMAGWPRSRLARQGWRSLGREIRLTQRRVLSADSGRFSQMIKAKVSRPRVRSRRYERNENRGEEFLPNGTTNPGWGFRPIKSITSSFSVPFVINASRVFWHY